MNTLKSQELLRSSLRRIDGRGYKAYEDIKGSYDFAGYTLAIDYVQPDPFAPPSQVIVHVPQKTAAFPHELFQNRIREVALEDYLTRRFYTLSSRARGGSRGTGGSGLISIDKPPQEVFERTSVFVRENEIEARFVVGLPARGRTVLGRQAEEIFFEEIPLLVKEALIYRNLDEGEVKRHVDTVEDADSIRRRLAEKGLVAFVADGAVLPRASGVDDRPLAEGRVVQFRSPERVRVEFTAPNRGDLSGMGIPSGVTLIVGGGYHGKSTLLNAIEKGIYNHIPGDGREFVVTDARAIKIRAEDGRSIANVDISPFINNLPFGKDTRTFSTADASGSTSQAANIIEALEAGANILLMDEDTSATNFMIRDGRMQRLVAKPKEPITPFIDKVRQLHSDLAVSTVLVMGGTGDYFEVADMVIMMDEYIPCEVTREAKEIAKGRYSERSFEGGERFGAVKQRRPLAQSLDASRGRREARIAAKGLHTIAFGYQTIDLSHIEQIADISQTRAIGDILYYAREKYMDGKRTLAEILSLVEKDLEEKGMDILSPYLRGDYAMPRMLEVAAALNRLRTLQCA
ncbi:MAG: ABC-ATPase domain-containing protein [Candidatus Aureabacteria bacterium]|nr:ABC-ATPase domain-containing protein [Candidatus Auribacterota bacterium]